MAGIDPVTGKIISAGIQGGAALGSAGLTMFGQNKRNQKAMEQQMQLMGYQTGNQMRLNQQGADLQYEMWKKTNYPAQVKMLKEAGLNPALLYGMSGGGGTTTGSQSGGSAAGGNAPQQPPMDMSNALIAAQVAKLAAETAKIKEDTKETGQDIINKKVEYNIRQIEQWNKELEYEFNKETFNTRMGQIGETYKELVLKNDMTRDMYNDLVSEQFAKSLKMMNDAEFSKIQAKLGQKELDIFDEVFDIKLRELKVTEGKLDIENRNAWTRELEAEIKNRLGEQQITVQKWNIIMRSVDNLIDNICGLAKDKSPQESGYDYKYEDYEYEE